MPEFYDFLPEKYFSPISRILGRGQLLPPAPVSYAYAQKVSQRLS